MNSFPRRVCLQSGYLFWDYLFTFSNTYLIKTCFLGRSQKKDPPSLVGLFKEGGNPQLNPHSLPLCPFLPLLRLSLLVYFLLLGFLFILGLALIRFFSFLKALKLLLHFGII